MIAPGEGFRETNKLSYRSFKLIFWHSKVVAMIATVICWVVCRSCHAMHCRVMVDHILNSPQNAYTESPGCASGINVTRSESLGQELNIVTIFYQGHFTLVGSIEKLNTLSPSKAHLTGLPSVHFSTFIPAYIG